MRPWSHSADSDLVVAHSFHTFVGADGYTLTDLRDLNRFAALLGGLEIPAHDLHAAFLTRPATGHADRGDVEIHGYNPPRIGPE